jgi:hypothetical protein
MPTNGNPENEQPSNKDAKTPPAVTRFISSKNLQAVKPGYRADDGLANVRINCKDAEAQRLP